MVVKNEMHQAALAAGLRRAGPEVGVLPEDPVVLFVQADRVRQRAGVAGLVGDHGVEVGDVADAVAAELERVGVAADQVLAGVEVVLPRPDRRRVAVRHDHLGDRRRGARSAGRPVANADLVQHQAFAGVEADAQRPVLPLEEVAVEGEAGALRLGDLDRLLRRPRRSGDGGVVEVARLLGDRHRADVDDLVDGLGSRRRRRRPGRRRDAPRRGPSGAPARTRARAGCGGRPPRGYSNTPADSGATRTSATSRPRAASAASQRSSVARICSTSSNSSSSTGSCPSTAGSSRRSATTISAVAERRHVVSAARGDVVQQHADDAVGRVSSVEGFLRRLLESEVDHARGRREQAGVGEHLPGGGDLLGGQRGERVGDGHRAAPVFLQV